MNISKILTRRSILGGGAIAVALSAASPLAKAAHHGHAKNTSLLSKGNTILFQGDSITDAGRDKKNEIANNQRNLSDEGMLGWPHPNFH